MLSNSDVELIYQLYDELPGINITVFDATRMIKFKSLMLW